MKLYELTYLISPHCSEEDLRLLKEKLKSWIEKEGGEILSDINISPKRELAYPIKKNKEAFLAYFDFQFPREKIGDLEKKLKSEGQILRYLLLSKKLPKEPKPVEKPKKPIQKPKVKIELKEIEKKLEEILAES